MSVVIFDIDGTIADCTHRLHYLKDKDWDSFYRACSADTPIISTISLLRVLSKDHQIVLSTGRPERIRTLTEKWLLVHLVPYEKLLMRKDKDWRASAEIKKTNLFKLGAEAILCAFDDKDEDVEMYNSMGVTCFKAPNPMWES